LSRSRVTRIDRRKRGENGVAPLFALQSAIGNRASASLMREAATQQPVAKAGQTQVYLTIEGEKQGKFKGGTNQRGREGAIPIHKYKIEMSAPRDAASGQATGKRQHHGITFTKAIDDSSPQFMQALTNNETFKSVKFEFVKPGPDGKEVVFQTVTLEGAQLGDWTQEVEGGEDAESVLLVYQKITLGSGGGTTATDDWAKKQ
jgi:type VI secretion system secreted protein Hcp